MDSSKPRLFFAIKFQAFQTIRETYRLLKQTLKKSSVKWADEKQAHITLSFLGETPATRIDSICVAAKKAAAEIAEFDLNFSQPGYFGKPLPRVIWLGIEENMQLKNLFECLTIQLSAIAVKPDSKAFKPHLTIGRIKFYDKSDDLANAIKTLKMKAITESILIDSFFLIESKLTPTRPIYTEIAEFKLKPSRI